MRSHDGIIALGHWILFDDGSFEFVMNDDSGGRSPRSVELLPYGQTVTMTHDDVGYVLTYTKRKHEDNK